jgi:Skp family chaperone for outer membrane proteins
MKKIYFLFALVISLIGTAQKHYNSSELTSEQHAALKTKKLQLVLDLNEEQAKKIEAEIKKQEAQFSEINQRKEALNSQDRYALRMEKMNRQIDMQNKMKSILSEEQYAEWRKMNSKFNEKNRRRGHSMNPSNGKEGRKTNKRPRY